MSYCKKCGVLNLQTAKFCGKCGANIFISSEEASPPPINKIEVVNPPIINNTSYTPPISPSYPWEPSESKQKQKKIILAFVAVALLAIAGFSLWYFVYNKNETISEPIVSTEVVADNQNLSVTAIDTIKIINTYINSNGLSESENNILSQLISRHTLTYNMDDESYDYLAIENDYSEYVDRFYSKSMVEKLVIIKDNRNYFETILRKCYWQIDSNKTYIQKNEDGTFDIDLHAQYFFYYQFSTKKFNPNIENHLQLHNRYKLNADYKIIEQYEVARKVLTSSKLNATNAIEIGVYKQEPPNDYEEYLLEDGKCYLYSAPNAQSKSKAYVAVNDKIYFIKEKGDFSLVQHYNSSNNLTANFWVLTSSILQNQSCMH